MNSKELGAQSWGKRRIFAVRSRTGKSGRSEGVFGGVCNFRCASRGGDIEDEFAKADGGQ